jgi:glycosyltransferase involved in cell wall biosynthesis
MTTEATPGGGAAPTFSVLIAAYNQADYVLDTLETVAAQNFVDYELVIVNDGSTDDTEARVCAWIGGFREGHANRVVFASTANGGQSAAFEHGFGLCSGRYIALLDSDDRWLPEKLARVAEVIAEDAEAGMIMHPLFVIGQDGRRTGDVRPMRAKLSEGDVRREVRETTRSVVPATTGLVVRADVFRSLVPFPTKSFRADADAYITFGACLAAPIRAIREPLGEYRMHSEGHYLRRVTTADGLGAWLDMQRIIARHFGVEGNLSRNSYYTRHAFAFEKLAGSPARQWKALAELLRSTMTDPFFGARQKLLFAGFWTLCALAPRNAFERLWLSFQLRHTGHDKLPPAAHQPAGVGGA